MEHNDLHNILSGRWLDKETGKNVSFPISPRNILIEYDSTKEISTILPLVSKGKNVIIVSDENTHKVLGKRINSILKREFNCDEVIFPKNISPISEVIDELAVKAKSSDVIIAVGSGTINDICKYASFHNQQPYVICATAPSMNGYLSANASIIIDGHKASVAAHLPAAVIMDLEIISEAPKRLIQSGFGDLLCRSTAQADWLMSHLIFGTAYSDLPFDMIKGVEEKLHNQAFRLLEKDFDAMKLLCEALLISGIGMYVAGGSYPASQAEHMIAHTIEMKYGDSLPKRFHGEIIAVTTIIMASLQSTILDQNKLELGFIPVSEDILVEFFGDDIAKQCLSECSDKRLTQRMLDRINSKLESDWPNIVKRIRDVSISSEKLQELALTVDLETEVGSLGLNKKQYREVVALAPYTRSRCTFLDLIHMEKIK